MPASKQAKGLTTSKSVLTTRDASLSKNRAVCPCKGSGLVMFRMEVHMFIIGVPACTGVITDLVCIQLS